MFRKRAVDRLCQWRRRSFVRLKILRLVSRGKQTRKSRPPRRTELMKGTEMERTANVPEDLTGRPRRVATGGVSWRNTFSAFQYRNYRLYFWGQLVSLIGTWMTSTAQGWLVYQLTGSKALLGIVAAAGTAP